MYKVIQNNLYMTKGDTAKFPLRITYMDDSDYVVEKDDKIIFTVKKKSTDSAVVIQKEITNGELILVSGNTKNLSCGRYCYDVQLTKPDGTVITIIPPHIFKLCEEVTF